MPHHGYPWWGTLLPTGSIMDLHDLEPGCDENPLERPTEYNPFRYVYPIIVDTEIGQVEVMIRFIIGQGDEPKHPIYFTRDGISYTIPLFPEYPVGLVPIDHNDTGYQVGEVPYTILPAVVRARKVDLSNGEYIPGADGYDDLLSETACKYLVSPDTLLQGILKYREKTQEDTNAPAALLEILDHFSDDYWDNPEDEDDWD